jgi:hypothetical protein
MKFVNEFGVTKGETQAGFAVEMAQDEVRRSIKHIVKKHELNALDIIMLQHKLIMEVTATCSEEALMYSIAYRRKSLEKILEEKAGQQDTKVVS